MPHERFTLVREEKERFEITSEIVEAGSTLKLSREFEPHKRYFIAHLGPVLLDYIEEHTRQFRWGYTWDKLLNGELGTDPQRATPAQVLETYGRTTTLNFVSYHLQGELMCIGAGGNFTLHEARWKASTALNAPIDHAHVSQFNYPSRIPWVKSPTRRYGYAEEHEKHVKLKKLSGETRNYSKERINELFIAPERESNDEQRGELALIVAMDRTRRKSTLLTSEFALVRGEGLYESGTSFFRVIESETP